MGQIARRDRPGHAIPAELRDPVGRGQQAGRGGGPRWRCGPHPGRDRADRVSVERIWLTHGHLDHAGGAVHELRDRRWQSAACRSRDRTSATNSCCEGSAEQGRAYGFAMRNVTPDRWLREGDSVTLGEHRFDVLHCPGHTPGHVVFVNQAGAIRAGGRCAVPGLDRPHRLSLRRPRRADPRHHRASCCRWATTSRSCAATARARRSVRSGRAIRSCADFPSDSAGSVTDGPNVTPGEQSCTMG